MLTIYLRKSDIPKDMEYIECNDHFFEFNVNIDDLDNLQGAKEYISKIDQSVYIGNGKVISKFSKSAEGYVETQNMSVLSTGCKTLLNVLLFPEKVFNTIECGYNAVEEILKLDNGNIYLPIKSVCIIEKPVLVIKNGMEYFVKNIDDFWDIMEDAENESEAISEK